MTFDVEARHSGRTDGRDRRPPGIGRASRSCRVALAGLGLLAGLASGAAAHPMGNFTVNRYARIEPGPEALALLYVVDYAEIPTFQELSRLPSLAADLDPQALGRAPEVRELEDQLVGAWVAGLSVTVDDRPVKLQTRSTSLEFLPGVGGLPTMKLRIRLEGAWPTSGEASVRYEDANAPDRLGWRELVLRPVADVAVVDSTVSTTDRSAELSRYPTDPDAAFPQETTARLSLRGIRAATGLAAEGERASDPARASAAAPANGAATLPHDGRGERLSELITRKNWTPRLVVFALIIAFALGGLHALSPGHGKAIVAAYLVGSRGTVKHAALLGAIVTIAHTAGVFLLGFVTLALSARILPEKLYPVTQLLSGLTIVAIGATMFATRLRAVGHAHPHGSHAPHTHEGEDDHGHAQHAHSHAAHSHGSHSHDAHSHDGHSHGGHSHDIPADAPTAATLLALGVSGGILPCPSALVVLLSAIALHRIVLGLVLIVAFSLGLAAVLSAIGIAVVRAGKILSRFESAAGFARRVPAFSALFVALLGIGIVATALPEVQRAFF